MSDEFSKLKDVASAYVGMYETKKVPKEILEMTQEIRQLIDAIEQGKSIDIEGSFEAVMAEKVSTRIEELRTAYAQSMFNEDTEEEFEVAEFDQASWDALSEEEQAEWVDLDREELEEAMSKQGALHSYVKNKLNRDFEKHIGGGASKKDMAGMKKNMVKAKKVIKKSGGDMKTVNKRTDDMYRKQVSTV